MPFFQISLKNSELQNHPQNFSGLSRALFSDNLFRNSCIIKEDHEQLTLLKIYYSVKYTLHERWKQEGSGTRTLEHSNTNPAVWLWSQIDHAQESVTSIFSQYWIKLFVKLGRWYSTGLKFLYQRTFNSRINKSFSHTTLKRPLSSSTHGDSTVLIIITLSDKEIRQVLCRKDKSKWMFDVQICTQFILRFRRMPMKEVDWVPLTWKVLTIKTNRRVKKRVNSTIFSASRISIQSYLPCLKWTLLPFYLYLWKLLWKSPVNVSFCGKSAITKTWINN